MKIYSYLLFPAALASLAFTTSVKAEEVSTKAADLMGGSNLLAQSSDPAFTPASPTLTPSTPLYTGGDINPDLPASNYSYGSLSVGFGSQSDVEDKTENTKVGDIRFNSAFSFNAAIGRQYEQFRAEIEVGNQFLSAKEFKFNDNLIPPTTPLSGNINATTILLNGYYDIPTGSKLRPYVGGGLGLGIISGKVTDNQGFYEDGDVDLSGTSFAYQLKAGVQYEVTRKGNVFGELKYSSISSYKPKEYTNVNFGPFNSFGFAFGYRQGF
ncbi:MAG: outer membrane protein [Cylindrospermopsis raciborskii]|uniref:outer membrane protein n=1 Tax=Cylindrospermopsis raciborskii TaxID=77022 RepID=UPI003D0DC3CF